MFAFVINSFSDTKSAMTAETALDFEMDLWNCDMFRGRLGGFKCPLLACLPFTPPEPHTIQFSIKIMTIIRHSLTAFVRER